MRFEALKYKNRWAVFDTCACVWYFTKGGKRGAEKMAKELNKK